MITCISLYWCDYSEV